ncbi:MAG: hypothetical protein K1X75_15215 [Leptospirales bacterium]|nr:hypothetical protein [Leptospirales bacterium]
MLCSWLRRLKRSSGGRRYLRTGLALVAAFGAAGCLSLGGRDLSQLSLAQRSAFLVNFSNATFEPDVNVELTEMVRQEGERRGRLLLGDDRSLAQTVIYGEVTLYRKEGRLFDNYRNATRYELIVACRIRLRDGSGGDGVFYSGELAARTEFAESEGAVETERRARGRLLRQLAAQIHQAIEIAVADRASAPASAPDGQR